MSGKIFEPGGGGNRHGERIESRVARCGPRRHATRRLTTARAISNRCDRELGTPSSELDLIAGMEAYVLDALTVEPSTVPAASVDQEVASVFVADLRVPGPAERAQQASDLHRFAKTAIESQLRFLHPDWTDEQVNTEMLRRLTGGAA